MLASALRRDVCDRTLEDLQQRLLHALAGDVARDRGVLALTGDLVHLVDVDDAALGQLDVKVRRLKQPEQDILHILTDVAGLGERGGVRDGERHVQDLGQRLGEQCLAGAGRANEQDVALLQLHIGLLRKINALIVVIDRHRQRDLRRVLPDDILVHIGFDLLRGGQLVRQLQLLRAARMHLVMQDRVAEIDTLVADIDPRPGDQPPELILMLAAKGAADIFLLVVTRHGYTS